MNMAKVNGKKLNRRVAFRIHEQANLFYRKLDHDGQMQAPENFHDLLGNSNPPDTVSPQALPDSQSQENDTLNVNISASGIAFTAQEPLQTGDYLMLRILLLSSMTAIMTCCKVVYCKPSNPYESDRYPYLIGAQFVNLTPEDTALLNKHIDKTKTQQRAVNGLLLSLALLILAMPDAAFGLLMGLIHHVLEVVLHVAHLMFEYAEYNLDHVIEHAFHTDTHTTQVIVFYILCTLGLVGLYFLWRVIPRNCRRAGNSLIAFWCRKKASCLYFWSQQALVDKIKIVGIGVIAVSGYAYFGM
ncbi:PilZ domain-containing protein [Methylomonas sp. LW13]|uniref:PilZ domain-containing protein n=2 Tax=unclassified Methylomonas TaxID=2608980 RepID=UPI00051B4DBE|nr:PilZ domain-containing protein [Methylomonas sp. LW13]